MNVTCVEDPIASIERNLQERIGTERFEQWFDRKTIWKLEGEVLIISASSEFAANWIRSKFFDEARAAAGSVLPGPIQLQVQVDPAAAATLVRRTATPSVAVEAPIAPQRAFGQSLSSKYALEEFVVGSCNQMAYHAAHQVATSPGRVYNPLFLHGHCGLGKTHLLQGICKRFSENFPNRRWLYLTGEQFTNDFIDAIGQHKTDAFRRRIRQADLLVIDDVHFLANKKATQEEFLHSFNQIDAAGKQIILASDCAPRQIRSMAESLVSRFVSGMVLRIDPPDLPTRLEILRRKCQRMNWQVSDAVLMHIGQSVSASVRELEGMLLQVMAGLNLAGGEGSGAVASSLVNNLQERTGGLQAPMTPSRVLEEVATFFNLSPALILGSSREKTNTLARSVCMYLVRKHTRMSFPEIGRALGKKNHSSVIGACQRIEEQLTAEEMITWNGPDGLHHQALSEVIYQLESNLRKRRKEAS